MSAVVERLDKVNGNIARQQGEINSLQVAGAKQDGVAGAIATLQADVEKLKSSTLTTDTKIALTEKYAGALWAAGGASFIALWQHLPAILKSVGADGK